MSKIDKDFMLLCTYLHLQGEFEKIKPYDGYSKEDLEEFFEKDNGYNLNNKFSECVNSIIDHFSFYISEDSLQNIQNKKKYKDFNKMLQELKKCEEELLVFNLKHTELIMHVLTDLYFYNKREQNELHN